MINSQAEKEYLCCIVPTKKTSHILYEMPFLLFYAVFFVVSRFFQS